jgi:hypothetical protein
MIVQAIALLDDLDKEINIYAMRVKEWYGWHFPEMGKIITDNLAYAKVIKTMGKFDCRFGILYPCPDRNTQDTAPTPTRPTFPAFCPKTSRGH